MSDKKTKIQTERNSLLQAQQDQDEEDAEENKASMLLISFFLMLFFQLGNRIFFKLATEPLYNYPIYFNFASTVLYIPICFAYIIPVAYFAPSIIAKEQWDIPLYKFAIMGTFDSISMILMTIGNTYVTNASIIVLIQQLAIPISMIISYIGLDARYTTSQYVGASIVVAGIILVFIPLLTPNPSGVDDYADDDGSSAASSENSSSGQILWMLVLGSSCIPMCLSSVYKEWALGEDEIDVVYLNGWDAFFQSIFSIPLCIPSAMLIGLPMSEVCLYLHLLYLNTFFF